MGVDFFREGGKILTVNVSPSSTRPASFQPIPPPKQNFGKYAGFLCAQFTRLPEFIPPFPIMLVAFDTHPSSIRFRVDTIDISPVNRISVC